MPSTLTPASYWTLQAPQEVLHITQYPYMIRAEYSEPSSLGSELDPLAQTATHGPGSSLGSVWTSLGHGGSESPQESDWDSESLGIPYSDQGDLDPQFDPAPPRCRRMGASDEAKFGRQCHIDGLGNGPDPRRGDPDP